MTLILIGALSTACFVAALFFLRFWKKTRDRFFLFFAASFLIQGVERILIGLARYSDYIATLSAEEEPLFYLMRLLAFLLIIYAIIDKNRLAQPKP
jgi:hypothetical protein